MKIDSGAEPKVNKMIKTGFVPNNLSNPIPIKSDANTMINVAHPTSAPTENTAALFTLGVLLGASGDELLWFMAGRFYHIAISEVNISKIFVLEYAIMINSRKTTKQSGSTG
jgi:hypothetical protein